MAFNKVIYEGETLIDLTGDTVTPDTLMVGATAHAANGEVISGTATGGSDLYLYNEGEENLTQVSHNAVNDEGGENELDPTAVNITTGRSSFTNGQKNRNGAYFSIVTGQNNALPRLFAQTLPDGTVVKKWRSSSSNVVGGTGNFVTSGNGVTGGNTNQNAGGGSLVVGEKNQEWTTGSSEEDGALLQASITAYKNYSLYGANTDGYILGKDGNATTTRLNDLKFVSVTSCNNIVGGLTNIGRSANSIISGKGNFVASSESLVMGSNNKLYNKTYAGPTSATGSLYTYHKSNAVLGDDNQIKGRYNKIIGDRNIALTADGSSDYRQNLKIIGNDNTVNSDNKIIIGNNITDPARSITIGNGAEAIGISSDNIVYLDNARVTSAPTKDTSVLRKLDVIDGSLDGSFSTLKVNGSNVVTNNTFSDKLKSSLASATLLAETNTKFNRLTLARKANETSLELTDVLRLADICTTGSTGATYAAIDAKFASIKMKATPGNEGSTNANTGNGSTFIEPDKITTNEIAVKDITGDISRLATPEKNLISAINELDSREKTIENKLVITGGYQYKLPVECRYIASQTTYIPSVGGTIEHTDETELYAFPFIVEFVAAEYKAKFTRSEFLDILSKYGAVLDTSTDEDWIKEQDWDKRLPKLFSESEVLVEETDYSEYLKLSIGDTLIPVITETDTKVSVNSLDDVLERAKKLVVDAPDSATNNGNIKNGEGDGCLVTKTGDDPEVDFINYAQHDGAVALGELNRADGRKSVALGTQNNVTSYIPIEARPYYVDAIADGNIYYLAEDKSKYILVDSALSEESYNNIEILYNYVRAQANSSIAVGQVNTVYGNCGGAFGSTNTLGINGGHSFIFGKNNYLDSYRSFIAGENNRGENGKYHQFILGTENIAQEDKEVLLGTGLKSSTTDQTVLGKFNDSSSSALFVVGGGSSDSNRRNVLEVGSGILRVKVNHNNKDESSFYVDQYGAYDIGGKLSNASNLNNGDAVGSLVAVHVSNAKANKATGVGSFVGGSANFWQEENNSVSGNNSIAWGYKTNVAVDHSYGLGWGINIKNGARKLAYGIYNEDKADTVFEIGKGNSDTDRKNIFEILNDGSISINDIKLTSENLQKLLNLISNLSDEKIKALNDFAQALEVTEGAQ